MKKIKDGIGIQTLNKIIERRLDARTKKDWTESDRIRDELRQKGFILKDSKEGKTVWEILP